ncbi:hypothetical protein CC86DRAFT_408881 [Ophiobolus disseminans]|uniref:Fungal N-terminal domain-containing protein n=1 Tax=Ophiobolus disseminans TaxID=1469910 RepID=A0A6A6ZS00_9PLEO|nr:hypothetical protein CC86DRAFT_408881 [Ophiobolus disseminans]
MAIPTNGDLLTLSQVAWKIGRAFTTDRTNAPIEFQEVEAKVGTLARALKQLAEALHAEANTSLIHEADENVQHGVELILKSCERTIKDLDSLVDHNQVIKKHRTVGGFAIERSWSDLVLREYKSIIWTTEGGDLHGLRDLLHMHTSSISLLIQALQSKSHSCLERVVAPMASRVEGIHDKHGNLDQQLEELHRILQDLLLSVPPTQTPPVPAQNPARSPKTEAANPLSPPVSPSAISPRRHNTIVSLPQAPRRSRSPESTISIRAPSSPPEPTSLSRASSSTQKRVSEFSFGVSSLRYSSSSYASSTASSVRWSNPGTPRDSLIRQQSSTSKKTLQVPRTPEVYESRERPGDDVLPLLPPPAMAYVSAIGIERVSSRTTLNPYPSTQPDLVKLHRSSTTSSQKAVFKKEAFRNSAVLCDVRGKHVEYSHQINEDDPRDVEMIRPCEDCRIAVVRKRVHDPETKAIRVVTSIWVFSDDNTIRMELRMDDTQIYIPYSSYFSSTKVSITVPCELKFHDVKHGNRPAKLAKTSWVNYVFDTPQAAALFQNELMGRTLLATFRTEKTMRIHEGLSKSFSYAEQMCGLENLRVWEDNDTGAIIALIHFSADFRAGYLAFYLNSSVNPIKVKDDGNREVKIRGLKVPIDSGRKDSVVEKGKGKGVEKEKVISGAKIEFASDAEKREFLEMCREVQKDLVELPELCGVN